jgi:hypothetical protein
MTFLVELSFDDEWQPRTWSVLHEDDQGVPTDLLVLVRPNNRIDLAAMRYAGAHSRTLLHLHWNREGSSLPTSGAAGAESPPDRP